MPHRDYTEVLSSWRRIADEARRLQSQVDAVFREREDAYKERDVLRKEVAALRAQIKCHASLCLQVELAANCNAENSLRLQSELTAMRVERDLAYQEREMLSKNVVELRAICEVMSPDDFPTEGDEVRPVKRGRFGYVSEQRCKDDPDDVSITAAESDGKNPRFEIGCDAVRRSATSEKSRFLLLMVVTQNPVASLTQTPTRP